MGAISRTRTRFGLRWSCSKIDRRILVTETLETRETLKKDRPFYHSCLPVRKWSCVKGPPPSRALTQASRRGREEASRADLRAGRKRKNDALAHVGRALARHISRRLHFRTQLAVGDLSRTELRVLRYLPTNLSRPDIARELRVSVNTVNTHMRNIYSKLGAVSRTEAVERARQLRLLAH
jgi:DNA-binding CsgD family transcriptional regulator